MVNFWRDHPVLYDTCMKDLNIKAKKDVVHDEIAAQLNIPQLLKKMASLRTAYGRMFREDRKLRRSGSRFRPTTARRAWIFGALSFLERFMMWSETEESANLQTDDDDNAQPSEPDDNCNEPNSYEIHTMSTTQLVQYTRHQQELLARDSQQEMNSLQLSASTQESPSQQDEEKLSAKRRRQRRQKALTTLTKQIVADKLNAQ